MKILGFNFLFQMTDDLILGVNDLKDFAQVIKPARIDENPIIVRKGTTQDIILTDTKSSDDETKHENESNSIDYTQEEFEKDFHEERYDLERQFEDDSRQTISNYTITEREEQTLEEIADTVSSSQVFGGGSRKMYVIRAKLFEEDPRTIDIDVQETKLIMFSHKYKMRAYFTKPVLTTNAKSAFIKNDHLLEVIVRQK